MQPEEWWAWPILGGEAYTLEVSALGGSEEAHENLDNYYKW